MDYHFFPSDFRDYKYPPQVHFFNIGSQNPTSVKSHKTANCQS